MPLVPKGLEHSLELAGGVPVGQLHSVVFSAGTAIQSLE
jgi:hypothetical protein